MEQCVFRNFPFPFLRGIGSGNEGNEEGIFRRQGSAVHLAAKGLAGVIAVGQLGCAGNQGHIVQFGMVDGIDQRLSGGVLQGEADGQFLSVKECFAQGEGGVIRFFHASVLLHQGLHFFRCFFAPEEPGQDIRFYQGGSQGG